MCVSQSFEWKPFALKEHTTVRDQQTRKDNFFKKKGGEKVCTCDGKVVKVVNGMVPSTLLSIFDSCQDQPITHVSR